jgi:hypothetical protein
MAEAVIDQIGANEPAVELHGPSAGGNINFMERYDQEKQKRYQEGVRQYIDISQTEKYKHFLADPWIESGTPINRPVPDGGQIKFLICGAGFGGVLYAVKLIQAGFKASDLLLVDPAGGFGGTCRSFNIPRLSEASRSDVRTFRVLERMSPCPCLF